MALAVPLYRNLALVRENLLPMAAALAAGALVAIVSAVGVAAALGAPRVVLISLAPKSITAAVAMAVSERAGGLPSLTAALVNLTGVIGGVVVTPMMNALRIRDYAARGFAAGLASTASARRALSPSIPSRACSRASLWGSTRWRRRSWFP